MNKTLINIFKKIESIIDEINKINERNREFVSPFHDVEESKNLIVIENLKEKNLCLEEYSYLVNKAKRFIDVDPKPIAMKCNSFINQFSNTQEALDYINAKLKDQIVLDGTRELFTSLAYTSTVSSYSPLNLYYVEYKFPQIFGYDIILIYDDKEDDISSEELEKILLESFEQFDSIYEETEEKIINPGFEGEEEYN